MEGIHFYIAKLLDILYREPRFIWKHYRPFSFNNGNIASCNIFFADDRMPLGGMFDRLKGMITIYAISKVQGKEFKINFTHPFPLINYLMPNQYDWRVEAGVIRCNYPSSKPVIAFGEYRCPSRLLKKSKRERHFYYGYDSLDYINAKYHKDYTFGQLYQELFKPTPYL
jgi:hypothetical protein